jgi:FLVCR family MFS transporter 7
VLFVAIGAGIAMFNTLYTVMQQLMCARGYSTEFSGACSVFMIVSGLVGGMFACILGESCARCAHTSCSAGRWDCYEEMMKVLFSMSVVAGITMIQFARWPHMQIPIALLCVVFGATGIGAYVLGNELAAECLYPVAETTSVHKCACA